MSEEDYSIQCEGCGTCIPPLYQEHFQDLCINCHDEWKSATQREF